ncbi:MAG: 16S rRNA (guanine(966)-N(2))-methyltransferase RsmD [Anaerovoracaceae bacterium]
MRIISGKFGGRKLESPTDNKIRPTTDKVKEALFSILFDKVDGATVVDLFAGTGNLGIEAISRGAHRAYFVDPARDSIKIIKENLKKLDIAEEAVVLPLDFNRALEIIEKTEQVDLFFLDPPYNKGLQEEAIKLISEKDLLLPAGWIIAEHQLGEDLPETIGKYRMQKEKKYGKVFLSIYSE